MIKAGKQPNGAQRYRCQQAACRRTIFQVNYSDKGRLPETKRQIVEMALNGSGIRETARVLGIGTGTVLSELKKRICDQASQYRGSRHDHRARYLGDPA